MVVSADAYEVYAGHGIKAVALCRPMAWYSKMKAVFKKNRGQRNQQMKPTETATQSFNAAFHRISGTKGDPESVRNCLCTLTQSLGMMSTGLRATYMKLEEIEALLKKQNQSRK